jgi:hypothetical protein
MYNIFRKGNVFMVSVQELRVKWSQRRLAYLRERYKFAAKVAVGASMLYGPNSRRAWVWSEEKERWRRKCDRFLERHPEM